MTFGTDTPTDCPGCGKPVHARRDRLCRECGFPLFLEQRQPSSPEPSVSRSPGTVDDATKVLSAFRSDHPTPPQPPASRGAVTCLYCHHANSSERVRCEQCGRDLRAPVYLPAIPAPLEPVLRERPRIPPAVLASIGAVIVAVVAVVFAKSIIAGKHVAAQQGTKSQTTSVSAPPTVTSSPPPPNPLVDASAVAGQPHAAAVVQTLTLYFGSVNAHNIPAARKAFDPSSPSKPKLDQSLSTTRDDRIFVTAIRPSGAGVLTDVTFRSRQNPRFGPAPDHAGCDNWTITYRFTGQFKIMNTPAASHSAC